MAANNTGTTYATKLDDNMRKAMLEWFNHLDKTELLQFLQDRDDLTADDIRTMLKNENIVLGFGIQYSVAEEAARVDFAQED